MANESFAAEFHPPRDAARNLTAEIVFVILLLVMFVGFTPFAPPAEAVSVAATLPAPGDFFRQILFLAMFFPILFAAFLARGWEALRMVPPTLLVVLAWCGLSVFWSAVPDITLRRAALAAIVTISTMASAELIGTRRAFFLWRVVLAAVLVVNFLSIPLIATAVHLPGDADPGLVGDWRGLYAQKNTAGAVCAMTAILFLFGRNGRNNWIGWLVAGAATLFLLMTRSKTSLVLLPVALLAGGLYRLAWRDALGRAIFLCGVLLVLSAMVAAAVLNWDAVSRVLSDPAGLTGRAEIWQAILAYMRDHPLLGAGFGTIAHTGALSPLHDYTSARWVEAIADSHNGYLQILIATGSIGLVLALIAMVADPLLRFWPLDPARVGLKALPFALFVFVLLHNFLETDFLESDNSSWFAFLVVLASLQSRENSLTLRA